MDQKQFTTKYWGAWRAEERYNGRGVGPPPKEH